MNIKDAKKAEAGSHRDHLPLPGRQDLLPRPEGRHLYPAAHQLPAAARSRARAASIPTAPPCCSWATATTRPGKQTARARLYSLIDQKQLYTFGAKPDPASYRSWYAYDSSALFDVESDTLIEPGENGVLYTIKLNTKFDKAAGTLTINPDAPVKANYAEPDYKDTAARHVTTPLWGMEDSAVAWKNYLYVADNGGKLFCWDLNTMKLVWVQNVLDDTNTSPVFEEENGTATSTSPPRCT